jgi:hypothetical protein
MTNGADPMTDLAIEGAAKSWCWVSVTPTYRLSDFQESLGRPPKSRRPQTTGPHSGAAVKKGRAPGDFSHRICEFCSI